MSEIEPGGDLGFDFGFDPGGHYMPENVGNFILRPVVEYYTRSPWFQESEVGDRDVTFKRDLLGERILEVTLEASHRMLDDEPGSRSYTMVDLIVQEELDGLGREFAFQKSEQLITEGDAPDGFDPVLWPLELENDLVIKNANQIIIVDNGAFGAATFRSFQSGIAGPKQKRFTLPLHESEIDDEKANSVLTVRHLKIIEEALEILAAPPKIKSELASMAKRPITPL